VSKLQEKMEAAHFLRDVAEAIRRYRGVEPDSDVRAEPVARPRDDFQRLADRLKRLVRRQP